MVGGLGGRAVYRAEPRGPPAPFLSGINRLTTAAGPPPFDGRPLRPSRLDNELVEA